MSGLFTGGTLGYVRAFFSTVTTYPFTFIEIPHIMEATPPSKDKAEVDTTDFDSNGIESSIFGLAKITPAELTCNADLSDTSVHMQLMGFDETNTTVRFRYEIAEAADTSTSKFLVYEMDARVATPGPETPHDGLKKIMFKFSNAGNYRRFTTLQNSAR